MRMNTCTHTTFVYTYVYNSLGIVDTWRSRENSYTYI